MRGSVLTVLVRWRHRPTEILEGKSHVGFARRNCEDDKELVKTLEGEDNALSRGICSRKGSCCCERKKTEEVAGGKMSPGSRDEGVYEVQRRAG